MPWIEGVGDEVTVTVALIAVLFIILVAWISTGIRDIPFIRVVVVQLTRRRQQQAQVDQAPQGIDADLLVQHHDSVDEASLTSDTVNEPAAEFEETEATRTPVDVGDGDNPSASIDKEEVENKEEDENQEDTEETITPVTTSELRQRRVDFFKGSSNSSPDNKNEITEQESGNKHTDERCEKDKSPSGDWLKESELKPTQTKGLSDLASNLLHEEVENSSREQTESNTSQNELRNQSRDSDNQSGENETPDEIRVRLKYLNDTQRLVTASPAETIGNFRRKHFTVELSQSKLVRFIFNGQDLRNDNSTLQACNIIDNSVVHCLITQPQEQTAPAGNQHDDGLFDIGLLMFPLFGILLGIVWYLRFMYRQFFNVTSTLTLGGITFLFIAALMSSLRGHRPHQHLE